MKWIDYIKDDSNIGIIFVYGCGNLVSENVKEIKNIWLAISNPYNKKIDAKYLILFNTNERLDYKNYGLNNKSIEFENLYNNKEVTSLRLDGNDLKDTGLTNGERSLSEVLSTCSNLEVLSLRNITGINSIEFVKSMPNLKELDLLGCNNVSDLSILETSCLKLATLRINNINIDLTKIQKTISRMQVSNPPNTFMEATYFYAGFYTNNIELLRKLSNCTEITNLVIHSHGMSGEVIDLSKCTKLKTIDSYYMNISFVVPNSVTSLYLGHGSAYKASKLDNASSLTTVTIPFEENFNDSNGWIEELAKCKNLESIYIRRLYGFNSSKLALLKNCTKLKTINIEPEDVNGITGSSIEGLGEISSLESITLNSIKDLNDISTLSKLSKLNYLKIVNSKIEDITPLTNLTNLTYLILYGNQINSLKPLQNLVNLKTLNLEKNCIYDMSYYKDETGNIVQYNNLEIIRNLHYSKTGNLRNILLKDNLGIVDFSKINNLTWDSKSGF